MYTQSMYKRRTCFLRPGRCFWGSDASPVRAWGTWPPFAVSSTRPPVMVSWDHPTCWWLSVSHAAPHLSKSIQFNKLTTLYTHTHIDYLFLPDHPTLLRMCCWAEISCHQLENHCCPAKHRRRCKQEYHVTMTQSPKQNSCDTKWIITAYSLCLIMPDMMEVLSVM